VLGDLRAEPRLTEAFRTGAGIGWHEHHKDVFVGVDAFYRPGYVAELGAWRLHRRTVRRSGVGAGCLAHTGQGGRNGDRRGHCRWSDRGGHGLISVFGRGFGLSVAMPIACGR
jgi:hypothetical protein